MNGDNQILSTDTGAPLVDDQGSLTAGPCGPLLLPLTSPTRWALGEWMGKNEFYKETPAFIRD
ncbi:hypothetical protein [Rhodanobacter sp. MP7CTX1]|uniref:hypothetical protein n=1 Tax=Rhodanobacter sp. MP7CTX1 TaxID=2723084 RepID=UPI00161EE50F|nr:hypothetical protein [Rhodanobacter sp. MP7CTX1]MBB6187873.1 hypothetical protein [Rhodanobacter sp. MP7CTX1]